MTNYTLLAGIHPLHPNVFFSMSLVVAGYEAYRCLHSWQQSVIWRLGMCTLLFAQVGLNSEYGGSGSCLVLGADSALLRGGRALAAAGTASAAGTMAVSGSPALKVLTFDVETLQVCGCGCVGGRCVRFPQGSVIGCEMPKTPHGGHNPYLTGRHSSQGVLENSTALYSRE